MAPINTEGRLCRDADYPGSVFGTPRPVAREFKTESISIHPYVGPNGELRINEKRALNV